jgi:hypothetical protein
MYPVRASSLRWVVTAALALMLCALFVTPTLAGEDLIPGQEVVSGTISFGGFGPVGPNCNATTGGSACTFAISNVTGKGKAVPGGPFTHTSTTTVLLGPGPGSFLFRTVPSTLWETPPDIVPNSLAPRTVCSPMEPSTGTLKDTVAGLRVLVPMALGHPPPLS